MSGASRSFTSTPDSAPSNWRNSGTEAWYIESVIASQLPPTAPGHGPQPQPQRVQLDEALGVELVVGALVLLERHHLHRIEAVRALAADAGHVALVQLHPHPAGDGSLTLVDQRLQHAAFRAEPEAVVDQLGIARHQA